MSKTIITPELKDRFLNELVNRCEVSELTLVNIESIAKELETTGKVIEGIFHQFVDIGLCVRLENCSVSELNVILNVEAHDMVRRGGFTAKEKILEENLEKLSLEIAQLRTKDTAQAARLTTILSDIANFFKIVMPQHF